MHNNITVCMRMYVFPVMMSFSGCLSGCVCVITGQKIDQTGGPETFLKLCLALPSTSFSLLLFFMCLSKPYLNTNEQ